MARMKRTSKVLERAQQRAAGLTSISPTLDLGGGLTLTAFTGEIAAIQARQETYNVALSAVDAAYNNLLAGERNLADLTERVFAGVAARYGKDSNEYEMAGGTRRSERKRPTRQPKPA